MILDINPTIRVADEEFDCILNARKIDSLYFIEYPNGKRFSIMWEKHEIKDFLPNKPISELIKNWEEGLEERVKNVKNSLKKGTEIRKRSQVSSVYCIYSMIETKVWNDVYATLDESGIRYLKDSLKVDLSRIGGLKFIKLIHSNSL